MSDETGTRVRPMATTASGTRARAGRTQRRAGSWGQLCQRAAQVIFHLGKVACGADARPPDQHVIHAGGGRVWHHGPRQSPQTSLGAIACDRVADLFGAGEANAHIAACVTLACLQNESGRCLARGAGCGEKLGPFRHSDEAQRQTRRRCGGVQILCIRLPFGHDLKKALRAERLATAGAARVQDLAASFGRHPRAEAVTALAHQVGWLKRAFHRSRPISWARSGLRGSHVFPERKEWRAGEDSNPRPSGS